MIVTLIFLAVFVLIILGFNYAIKIGKERTVSDNLVYLEFLIRVCTVDHISQKNIQDMFDEYLLRSEYQGDKLDELYEMFNNKFNKQSIHESKST